MKSFVLAIVTTGMLLAPARPARAQFSTDAPILLEILSNAISQLYQLMAMVQTAQNQLQMLREINAGVHDALNLMRTLDPTIDPGIYNNWHSPQEALAGLQQIYGRITQSRNAGVQRDIDQGVAEAVTLNNKLYDYAARIDGISELIERSSRVASPKGAARLSAQAMGVMLQVMNQSLKTQATTLKLQAQNTAAANRADKEMTRHVLDNSAALKTAMQNETTSFKTPRF